MPTHNLDIDAHDLSEAPRLPKEPQPKGPIIGACVAVVLFAGLLVYGSMPELTPHEIVSMDGYEGEQPTRHIFNIQSIEESSVDSKIADKVPTVAAVDQSVASTAAEPQVQAAPTDLAATAPLQQEPAVVVEPVAVEPVAVEPVVAEPVVVEPVVVERVQIDTQISEEIAVEEVVVAKIESGGQSVAPVATELAAESATESTSEPAEIPVVTPVAKRAATAEDTNQPLFSTAREERVVAAVATTPKINEAADTVVVSSAAAREPVPVPVGSASVASPTTSQASKGRLLPLRSVLEDFTELKESPTSQSKTLLSLGKGVVVSAFERHGEWIYIGTNDGKSVTGYVLESALGKVAR